MQSKKMKISTLSVLFVMSSSGAIAAQPSFLPLFKASEIPTLCDANLKKMHKQVKKFENKKIKNNARSSAYLAEWDNILAEASDFISPIGLYNPNRG